MTLVVASLPIRSFEDIQKVEKLNDADLIELRLDYMTSLPPVEMLEKYKGKIIVTIRDPSEGGVNYIDENVKAEYLKELHKRNILYDVEARFAKKYKIPTEGKIVSAHYFTFVPTYDEVYNLVREFLPSAWIIKVAVIGKPGYRELLSKLLDLEKVAVMPMGVNPLERIAFSLLGSKLIYTHVGEETAKGQLYYKTAKEILSYLTSISISSPITLTG